MPSELTKTGVVQSVRNGIAVVAVASGGCSSCGEKSGCAIGRMSGDNKTSLIEVATAEHVSVGDSVTLSMPQVALHRAALIGYLIPAVTLLAGAIAGQAATGTDGGAAIGALAGLLAGMIPGRMAGRRQSNTNEDIALHHNHATGESRSTPN